MKSQGREFASRSKYTAVMESLQSGAKSRDKTVRKIRCSSLKHAAVWGCLVKGQQR